MKGKYIDNARYEDHKTFDSDRSHAFENAVALLELSRFERENPNRDIFSSLRLIGISLIFVMLGTLTPFSSSSAYPIVGLTFGLIGSSAIVGCLFVLGDTILHADIHSLEISAILLMIVQYGLLFEYLLDSPAAEYLLILFRTVILAQVFGSMVSWVTRNDFLFPSRIFQQSVRAAMLLSFIIGAINSFAILLNIFGLAPYLGVDIFVLIFATLGMGSGMIIGIGHSKKFRL